MWRWRRSSLAVALAVLMALPATALAAPSAQLGGPSDESATLAWLADVAAAVAALDTAFTAHLLGRESWLRWEDPSLRRAIAEQLTALSAAAPTGDRQPLIYYSRVAPTREALDTLSAAFLAARADAARAALDRLRDLVLPGPEGAVLGQGGAADAAGSAEALRQAFALGWRPDQGSDPEAFLRLYWAVTLARLGLTAPESADWRQLQARVETAIVALGAQHVAQLGARSAEQAVPIAEMLPATTARAVRLERYLQDLQALSCRAPLERVREYARLLASQAAGTAGGGEQLAQLRAAGQVWQTEYARLVAWEPPAELTGLHQELLAGLSLLRQAAAAAETAEEASGRAGTASGQAGGGQPSGGALLGEPPDVAALQRAGYYSLARNLVRAARERLEALAGQLPPCPQPGRATPLSQ